MKITLPVSSAGQNATANTRLKGAKSSCCFGSRNAAPTCMRKGLIAYASDGLTAGSFYGDGSQQERALSCVENRPQRGRYARCSFSS